MKEFGRMDESMALTKCPRCELNYILDGGELCTVCRREVKGERETIDMPEMCSECGENPVVPGQELCSYCLKELSSRDSDPQNDEETVSEAANIGIDSVSTMDEIELDLGDDMDGEVFDEDDDFFADDDDDDDDEDEDENGFIRPKRKKG
jgi:hypothetical protein